MYKAFVSWFQHNYISGRYMPNIMRITGDTLEDLNQQLKELGATTRDPLYPNREVEIFDVEEVKLVQKEICELAFGFDYKRNKSYDDVRVTI